MKTVSPINSETLQAAFVASKGNGSRRATLNLISDGKTIVCHGTRCTYDPAVGVEIIRLLDEDRNEHMVDPSKDVINYDDSP